MTSLAQEVNAIAEAINSQPEMASVDGSPVKKEKKGVPKKDRTELYVSRSRKTRLGPVVPKDNALAALVVPKVGTKIARGPDGKFQSLKDMSRPPTVNQLLRWAELYQKQLQEGSAGQKYPTEIEAIDNLKGAFKRSIELEKKYNYLVKAMKIRKKITREDLAKLKEIYDEYFIRSSSYLIQRLSSNRDQVYRAISNFIAKDYNKDPTSQVKVRDIFLDLYSLCQNFPTLWVKGDNTIKVITDPMVVVDPKNKTTRYEFGRFYIHLKPAPSKPIITACTPRRHRRGSLVHPHVEGDGSSCLGEGEGPLGKALASGRIFDAVDIISGVLSHIGSRPFAGLSEWDGICDVRFDPETNLEMPKDAIIIPTAPLRRCGACSAEVPVLVNCRQCGMESCEGCMNPCSFPGCTNYACEDHYYHCDGCERRFCGGTHFRHSDSICDGCWADGAR